METNFEIVQATEELCILKIDKKRAKDFRVWNEDVGYSNLLITNSGLVVFDNTNIPMTSMTETINDYFNRYAH